MSDENPLSVAQAYVRPNQSLTKTSSVLDGHCFDCGTTVISVNGTVVQSGGMSTMLLTAGT